MGISWTEPKDSAILLRENNTKPDDIEVKTKMLVWENLECFKANIAPIKNIAIKKKGLAISDL